MRKGQGTRKNKKILTERPNKHQERKKRFVSSLEVSNVFQYNALQTIIQLQSLILYLQTSWFTYTVLLLSLKFNKTKCESLSVVQLFNEGGESDSTKPVLWGGRQWTIWLLKMACFLLHTSHILSNIYNSANFPDQSEHLQTIGKTTPARVKSSTVTNGDGKEQLPVKMLTLKIYKPVHMFVYIH